MGQLQSVQVHRLLSEDGVDAALVRMLAREKRTFDDFAAVSETVSASAQAVDVSDSKLIAQVLSEERERLAGTDLPSRMWNTLRPLVDQPTIIHREVHRCVFQSFLPAASQPSARCASDWGSTSPAVATSAISVHTDLPPQQQCNKFRTITMLHEGEIAHEQ
ncbi:hypothetical protein [Curtobacterium sp. B8]|uniref:hypothetical protein n=1 Tax=Curtobacterium sp. B8 TaxID=95611 RepID=UPI0003B71891|nr:hypothetical protein [Curtobacterium sp. B8]